MEIGILADGNANKGYHKGLLAFMGGRIHFGGIVQHDMGFRAFG